MKKLGRGHATVAIHGVEFQSQIAKGAPRRGRVVRNQRKEVTNGEKRVPEMRKRMAALAAMRFSETRDLLGESMPREGLQRVMGCGHAPQAQMVPGGHPFCAICVGLDEGATEVMHVPLAGRTAACVPCGRLAASAAALVLFEYRPERERDAYWCGCDLLAKLRAAV